MFSSALNRPIAFHADYAVDDREGIAELTVQRDDGFGNSDIVQLVFRPSVNRARDYAEEILHRERSARPMVRLHLREGDDQVGSQDRVREVKLRLAGEVLDGRHIIAI